MTMSLSPVYVFIVYGSYIFQPCRSSSYNYYSIYYYVKFKYIAMQELLIQAALREVDKIRHLRDYYAHTGGFQLGEMIFYLRRRVERMLFVYQKCVRTNDEHFEILREMHLLYIEIDHLMEMLEEFDIYDKDNPTEPSIGKNFTKPTLPPGMANLPQPGSKVLLRSKINVQSSAEDFHERTTDKAEEAKNLRRRQMAYLERKMILRNMARGLGNTTSPRKIRNHIDYEDGFDSDKL